MFISISMRTALSPSPGSIVTPSIAAAETEWMFGRRVSKGMRERPLAMSSASATRTMPASIVIGSPRRRWPITACSASETTTVSSGLLVDPLEQQRQPVGGEEQRVLLVVGAVDRHAGVVEQAGRRDHHLGVARLHAVLGDHRRLHPGPR